MSESALVYDLGLHTVEFTHEGMMLITSMSDDTTSLMQAVQLDIHKTYKLCAILQAWFRHDGDEHEGERACK